MESLNAYAQKLDSALENQKPYTSFNRDMAHAKIIVCTAMRHAKNDVWLLSNKLDPLLYASPSFINAATRFILDRGGRLHILVETEPVPGHPVVELSQNTERAELRRVPQEQVDSYKFNFMIVDDIGYRFESDRQEPRAFVTFNDDSDSWREMMQRLHDIFDYLNSVSVSV